MNTGNSDGNGKQQYTEEQQWTIRYMVAKLGATEDEIIEAITEVGNDTKEIEAYLVLKGRRN
ncbi:MAG: hypothetical protein K0Q66_1121 [Chitinophagaceae bacterium]|jgi:t-SNARE complex subunit (syntaxin)|nr:hypothetical protein [Chitinophagaceae bacterium]